MGTGRRWMQPDQDPFDRADRARPSAGVRQKLRTEWMGAVPRFNADAPPRDWERQHAGTRAIGSTVFTSFRNGARPVPRQANCHFIGVDRDVRNVYFY